MKTEPKNEQVLCQEIIRLIGQRRGEPVNGTERPDMVERTRPAVEWLFETPTAKFALEHTRIESFRNQISDGKQFAQLLEPLETELLGRLPGDFSLMVDVGTARVRKSEHKHIRAALGEWILEQGAALDADEDTGATGNYRLTGRPRGVPFEVTLHRDTRYGSSLLIIQVRPNDVAVLRRERVREALNRKCPKLRELQILGRISVLILESDDVLLIDRRAIAEPLVAELRLGSDSPDTSSTGREPALVHGRPGW